MPLSSKVCLISGSENRKEDVIISEEKQNPAEVVQVPDLLKSWFSYLTCVMSLQHLGSKHKQTKAPSFPVSSVGEQNRREGGGGSFNKQRHYRCSHILILVVGKPWLCVSRKLKDTMSPESFSFCL